MCKRRFNSTLVQLKVTQILRTSRSLNCFNSTLVQLKGDVVSLTKKLDICFNSTLVQLKEFDLLIKNINIKVSILP